MAAVMIQELVSKYGSQIGRTARNGSMAFRKGNVTTAVDASGKVFRTVTTNLRENLFGPCKDIVSSTVRNGFTEENVINKGFHGTGQYRRIDITSWGWRTFMKSNFDRYITHRPGLDSIHTEIYPDGKCVVEKIYRDSALGIIPSKSWHEDTFYSDKVKSLFPNDVFEQVIQKPKTLFQALKNIFFCKAV